MDYTALLLNQLLDAYERSAHFRGTAQVNRRITFPFNRQTLPSYILGENPEEKETLHQVVKELAQAGLVEVEWVSGEKNNLLRKVHLNLDHVDRAYARIQRPSRRLLLQSISRRLEQTRQQITTDWIRRFLAHCREEMSTHHKVPVRLPSEEKDLDSVLKALLGLDDKGDEQMLERIFSIKYLGDSKLFMQRASMTVISAARRFWLSDEELSDADVLHELGIVSATEELLLTGSLCFCLGQHAIDLAQFPHGAVIDTQLARQISLEHIAARVILLVENKTNYHYLIRQGLPPHLLLIYLGGFPGPAKRNFLRLVHQKAQAEAHPICFYHWGDIDWGGLHIYQLLEEKVLPDLIPFCMDEETLLRFRSLADSFPASYRTRLGNMRRSPRYERFHTLLDCMLQHNLRLEQEALLAHDDFGKELVDLLERQ